MSDQGHDGDDGDDDVKFTDNAASIGQQHPPVLDFLRHTNAHYDTGTSKVHGSGYRWTSHILRARGANPHPILDISVACFMSKAHRFFAA